MNIRFIIRTTAHSLLKTLWIIQIMVVDQTAAARAHSPNHFGNACLRETTQSLKWNWKSQFRDTLENR
jgi:hypothetical protein